MSKPTIKTVAVTKRGRFWAVHTDGQLLALALYKKGALAVRDLLMRLTSIEGVQNMTKLKNDRN